MKNYYEGFRLIPVDLRTPLEDVIRMLIDYYKKGEKVYVDYGCVLFSTEDEEWLDEILQDVDRLYRLVYGLSKEQYLKEVIENDFIVFGYDYIYPELHEHWRYVVENRKLLCEFDFNGLICLMRTLEKDGIDAALKEYAITPDADKMLNYIVDFSKKGTEFFRRVYAMQGKELSDRNEDILKRLETRNVEYGKAQSKAMPEMPIFGKEDLDKVVKELQRAHNRGEFWGYEINGKLITNAERPTMDSAYIEVYGCTKEELENKKKRKLFLERVDYFIEEAKGRIDPSLIPAWETYVKAYAKDETKYGTELNLILGTILRLNRGVSDEDMLSLFEFLYQYKRNGYVDVYNTVLEQVNVFSKHGELFVQKMNELEKTKGTGTQFS